MTIATVFLCCSIVVGPIVPIDTPYPPRGDLPPYLNNFITRARGESHSVRGMELALCTMKNRLAVYGDPGKVLRAYFAPDIEVSEETRKAMIHYWNHGLCDPSGWYLLSRPDLRRFNPGTKLIDFLTFDGLELYMFSR